MTRTEELPDLIPGGHVAQVATATTTLAQLYGLRRDAIERQHLEEMRDLQRQQERAETLQRQEERDQQRQAERASDKLERRQDQAERDLLMQQRREADKVERRQEQAERDQRIQEQREAEKQERRQEMLAREQERDAKTDERNRQREAEMAAREQERRRNRIGQLEGRAERAKLDIGEAIGELREAERRLEWLKKEAALKHDEFTEALDNNAPKWQLTRAADNARRADEEVHRGGAHVKKAEGRVTRAEAAYRRELDALTEAQRDYNNHTKAGQQTAEQKAMAEQPEAEQEQAATNDPAAEQQPTGQEPEPNPGDSLVIADPEGAEALEAARHVVTPAEGHEAAKSTSSTTAAAPPAAAQAHKPRRTR